MKGDVGPPGQCQCNVSEVIELRERLDELEQDLCLVGVKSGKVEDEDMTALSIFDDYYAAHEGRLDRTDGGGNCWQPPASAWRSPGEWLQVDLKTPTTMTGVVTQGRPDSSKWVTSFKIAFGNFTDHLKMIQDFDEEDVIFRGNRDRSSHVVNMFPNPVTARYFRLIVQTFHDFIALRLDYLTC
ncbi:unnamed protein product [Clavelina lepadiformis]|uniref:F5/8 type C domain-containing protein n=1 Tax=Clavelina lepadiformis TaxID=159417 RepID=A0ABP0FXL0_CLALP